LLVDYHLYPTLEKEDPLKALEKAFNFYKTNEIDISKLIHHSDRGSQYASSVMWHAYRPKGVKSA